MAENYYYLDIIDKKGPFSLDELRILGLPLDTLIWKEGWKSPKRISECENILRYFLLTPPSFNCSHDTSCFKQQESEVVDSVKESSSVDKEIHTIEVVHIHQANNERLSQKVNDSQSESLQIAPENTSSLLVEEGFNNIETIHPEMHWLPKTLMIIGIFGGFAQITRTCNNFLFFSPIVIALMIALSFWGIASIIGMFNKKRWGLISFFSYRLVGFILKAILSFENSSIAVELSIDTIGLLIIICIFFIKKDGHNTYELLWNNGVFYAPKVKEEALNKGKSK